MASAHIQHWALMLSAYNYEICYKPGADHTNADGLSRLPVSDHVTNVPVPGDVLFLFRTLEGTPVRAAQVRGSGPTWIPSCLVCIITSSVVRSTQTNQSCNHISHEQLSSDGCLLRGSRVVVPKEGKETVVSLLHEGHPDVTRMKRLARGYVWWPGIDKELEFAVKMCGEYQDNQKSPAQAPMHPWEWSDRPWARIHVDYAGQVKGKMILVMVDAHFATHGLPEVIVSDNGSCFTSEVFSAFVRRNGIKHLTSAPYHPASNG